MSDVTDLKAEVLLLRQENKQLRADQAHWELGNCPSCPNIADLQEALEQNGKLRELVRHMYVCTCHIDIDVGYRCDWCEYDNTEGKCDFERRLRELGVEVPE